MADEYRVGLIGIQLAISLVSDLGSFNHLPAIQRQILRKRKYIRGRGGDHWASGLGERRSCVNHMRDCSVFVSFYRAKTVIAPRAMNMRPSPKPWIADIHAYVPGKSTGGDGRALVKLSANENPLGTSQAALSALEKERGDAATYPDPGAAVLREQLGELHGLDPDRIVCGTGSDELLNLATQGFAGVGDEVIFSRYSFAVYDISARRCGASPIEVNDRAFTADVDAMLGAVTDLTRVVFLANPNNPTGTWLPPEEVSRLHAGMPQDVLLVIDEAYAEYCDPGFQTHSFDLAATHDNVPVSYTHLTLPTILLV